MKEQGRRPPSAFTAYISNNPRFRYLTNYTTSSIRLVRDQMLNMDVTEKRQNSEISGLYLNLFKCKVRMAMY